MNGISKVDSDTDLIGSVLYSFNEGLYENVPSPKGIFMVSFCEY